jgi:hypothetical protein
MAEGRRNGHGDPLTGTRRRADYNDAERRLSLFLQQRLLELLEGRRNRLDLLRKYPREPQRLGVVGTPREFPRAELRLPVVERLTWDAVEFIRADQAVGGPVSQSLLPDGGVVEFQTFPTKYPHILIERTDRYLADDPEPVETTWGLRRVQNQRKQTQINRLLDAANLAIDLFRTIR